MANMSYCRFQNTLNDLRDCGQALAEDDDLPKKGTDEHWAMLRLIEVCQDITDGHDPEDYK